MTTGFQINVDSCAFREITSFFKRQHLGMFDSFIAVKALAHNDAILYNNCADQRVRLNVTFTFGGKCKREIEKIQIALSSISNITELKRSGDHLRVLCKMDAVCYYSGFAQKWFRELGLDT